MWGQKCNSQSMFGFQVLVVSQRVKHLRGHASINFPSDLKMSDRFNQAPLWPMLWKSSSFHQIPLSWRTSTKRTLDLITMLPCSIAAPRPHQIPQLTLLSWSAPKLHQLHIMRETSLQPAMSLVTAEAMVTVAAGCPTEDAFLQMTP